METRRIAIYREEGSLTVAPRRCIATKGDEIIFYNTLDEDLILVIDEKLFQDKPCCVDIAAKGRMELPAVGAVAPGGYPYAVYCPEKKEFAHASVPIIIIYPSS